MSSQCNVTVNGKLILYCHYYFIIVTVVCLCMRCETDLVYWTLFPMQRHLNQCLCMIDSLLFCILSNSNVLTLFLALCVQRYIATVIAITVFLVISVQRYIATVIAITVFLVMSVQRYIATVIAITVFLVISVRRIYCYSYCYHCVFGDKCAEIYCYSYCYHCVFGDKCAEDILLLFVFSPRF